MPVDPFALTTHFSQPPADDYDSIHATVMETARGRWFLDEYARRNRNADTRLLLAAVRRLESALNIQTAIPGASHDTGTHGGQTLIVKYIKESVAPLTHQLQELRDAIVLTRTSLPEIQSSGRKAATRQDFDQIAKGISVISARMRWIAEQVSHKQRRTVSGLHDDLDKLAEGATMIAALLNEVELRIGAIVETMQAYAEAEAGAAAAAVMSEPAAVEAAAPRSVTPSAPPPVRDQAPIEPSPAPATTFVVAQPAPLQPQSDASETPATETAAAPPPDMRWLDALAPVIVGQKAPDPAVTKPVQFDIDEEPRTTIALPNPAQRESAAAEASAPAIEPQTVIAAGAPKAPEIPITDLIQRLVHETVVETIKETIAQAMVKTPIAAPAPAPMPAPVIAVASPPAPAAAASVAPPPAPAPVIAAAPAEPVIAAAPPPPPLFPPVASPRVSVAPASPPPHFPPAPVAHITAPMHADEHREDPSAFAFDLFSMAWQLDDELAPISTRPVVPPRAEPRPVEEARHAPPEPEAKPAPEAAPTPLPATILHMPPKTNGAIKPAAPLPTPVAKPSSPLAPIMALSDEEKIALFS
jgi:hypothetical protein